MSDAILPGMGRQVERGGFRRRVRGALLPLAFLGVSGYFVWHAVHGERGLIAREERLLRIADAQVELERARSELEAMERRVHALRGDRLDRDQLDERARQLLNMVGPNEVVIPYPPERRLF